MAEHYTPPGSPQYSPDDNYIYQTPPRASRSPDWYDPGTPGYVKTPPFNPLSLKELCRAVIRRQVVFRDAVDSLEIPLCLKRSIKN